MLAKRNIIVGMDIGTSNVRVIAGEIGNDATIHIIGVGTSSSEGLKKGVIVDLDRTVNSITRAIEEAERMIGMKINSTYVGLVGSNIELINNRGIVAVSGEDKEIREEDVQRVLQATKVIALPPDREIIDILPREFIVDGYDGIRDPTGMIGVRLEVDAMIITGPIMSLRNLERCINNAGLEIDGLILNSLANAEVILSRDEKELGVLLIDAGGGTTEVSFFQNGSLINLSVLPIGGDHITNDLAVGLHTTFKAAERLKIEHGIALAVDSDTEPNIEIQRVGSQEVRSISQEDLARFIEPRIQEILHLTAQRVEQMSFDEMPPAGLVITGGVSLMRGVPELAEEIFGTSVRIAQPDYVGVKSPIYSTAVGIIHYIQRTRMLDSMERKEKRNLPGLWNRIKGWFNDFLD